MMKLTTMRGIVRRLTPVLLCMLASGAQAHKPSGGAHPHKGNETAGVVIEWNELLEGVLPAGGLTQPRSYAMLHIAMFDAVNSIERKYGRYRFSVWSPPDASAEAAAAQAAHDVLVDKFPAAQATFDAALEARLAKIHPLFAKQGSLVGKAVARAVLEWRKGDGWDDPAPAYVLPSFPGLWQPAPGAAQFTQFPYTKPFGLPTPTLYLPYAPPTLTSEEYAIDFDEVKRLGSATSTERTAEQKLLAQLFASTVTTTIHWAVWNHVARDTAQERNLSLAETARLFALLNVSIHDAVQTSHTGKFIYGLWRPITAIRRAEEDANEGTAADLAWAPLISTPAYPTYPGNQACVGASAARALQLFFGADAVPFTAVWKGNAGNPDVARSYVSFRQLSEDQANSRIYAGIHFRFDNAASQENCGRVSGYVFGHFALAR